jgi:hypothetical protein
VEGLDNSLSEKKNMSSKNIKTAQFGGVGGGYQGSPFSPGASPIGRGGNPGTANDINVPWKDDKTLESMLSRIHMDQDVSDRNIETRLTPQHQYSEETKNYILDPNERLRAKFRAELHKYKKSLEEHADSLEKNSVEYINKYFQPKTEHVTTMEEQLKKRRLYNDDPKKNYFQYEDDIPELIQPTRIHTSKNKNEKKVISNYEISRPNEMSSFIDGNKDTADEENEAYKVRYQTYPSGSVKPMINMEDVEDFLKGGAGVNRGYVNDDGAYNEETVLNNQYKETLPNVHPRSEIAPMVKKINPFKSLEANFREVSPLDMYTRNNLQNQEAAGVEDLYPGQNEIGRFSPSPFSV